MVQRISQGYVVDTSALIDLWRHFPKDSEVFEEIWEVMSELIKKRKLIAPKEVLKELKKGGDKLHDWAQNQNMFVQLDTNQIISARNILRQFPNFVKSKKTSPPADADSLVIALAISRGNDWAVIAEETLRGNKLKIPYICQQLNVKCLMLADFFSEQGLKIQRVISSRNPRFQF